MKCSNLVRQIKSSNSLPFTKPRVHYCVSQKVALNQLNPLHILTHLFFKTDFSICHHLCQGLPPGLFLTKTDQSLISVLQISVHCNCSKQIFSSVKSSVFSYDCCNDVRMEAAGSSETLVHEYGTCHCVCQYMQVCYAINLQCTQKR